MEKRFPDAPGVFFFRAQIIKLYILAKQSRLLKKPS